MSSSHEMTWSNSTAGRMGEEWPGAFLARRTRRGSSVWLAGLSGLSGFSGSSGVASDPANQTNETD